MQATFRKKDKAPLVVVHPAGLAIKLDVFRNLQPIAELVDALNQITMVEFDGRQAGGQRARCFETRVVLITSRALLLTV